MQILCIDTTSSLCSVAIWKDNQSLFHISQEMKRGHAGALSPIVQQIFVDTELTFEDINEIIVNVGPGSFTGIRVGLAFCQGLAFSLKKPIYGIDSFQSTFYGLKDINKKTLVVIDAKRKDIFCQLFQTTTQKNPQTLKTEQIWDYMEKKPFYITGNGFEQVEGSLKQVNAVYNFIPPLWIGADALGKAYFEAHHIKKPANPFYLRNADITR